jgi:hypothetical protein
LFFFGRFSSQNNKVAKSIFKEINNDINSNENANYIELLKAPEQQEKLINKITDSTESIIFKKNYLQFLVD